MRKTRLCGSVLALLFLGTTVVAQLNGTNYTIDPSKPTSSLNYQTFSAAFAALGSSGVSGVVEFTVAATTFNEAPALNPVTGTSSTNTVTFKASGGMAVIDANAGQDGLTLNQTCSYIDFENIEVRNFTRYGLNMNGTFQTRATFCNFRNCKFDAPASTSSAVRAAYLYYPDDCRFEDCVFAGGGWTFYTQQQNRNVFSRCEFDGKGQATRLIAPYNSNDSDNLYENCFIHSCGASGLGLYINLSQYGNMFWHNTIIVSTSQNAVHLGGCCAWSRANSFRNNIVINKGTGVCIKYGVRSGVLEFNDADYNCYYAPNGKACELEGGAQYSLADWIKYFNANKATLVPAGGGSSWDQNSIEADPKLVSDTAPFDIHISCDSVCYDAGTTQYVAGTWISYNASYKPADDFEGDNRPATKVDIGADEYGMQLVGAGTGKVGTAITFSLAVPKDATRAYGMGSSLGTGPLPIDKRSLCLSADNLLFLSTGGLAPTIFEDYTGTLSNAGTATAKLNIPNIPALKNTIVHTAFVTVDGSAPSGIRTISNTFTFTID